MGRNTGLSNTGVRATKGDVAANTGGSHGGINPHGSKLTDFPTAEGSSGAPGTEFPWDGSDSTDIGANTQLPPLKSL